MKMRTVVLLTALAVVGLLLSTLPADAEDRPDYVLKLDVEKKEVTLGEDIKLTVGLSKKKGKPLKLELPMLAITTGEISITAIYTGLSKGPAMLKSEPVKVKVKAPEGKTEIAAVMETSEGSIVLTFSTEKTFNTTLNFLTLAKDGVYDGLNFHRIIKGFMAQGGDPKGNGSGGPGFYIPREIDPSIKHVRGVLSMARTQAPDSAGSQFFLMFGANKGLDGGYAAFGKAVEGESVIAKLEATKTDPMHRERSKPLKPPVIKTVKVMTR
jgi:peptidyl-prolyl cis-trans isomerase B (cyclophilin B)